MMSDEDLLTLINCIDSSSSSVITIQRLWRARCRIALVGLEVEDDAMNMIQSYYVNIALVSAHTTHEAVRRAQKINTDDQGNVQFIAWLNDIPREKWHFLCGVSGDTMGRGLSSYLSVI